ncbi:MAG TPA: hypothetical protein VJT31_34375 [Rugosimonospora sp.]|nr:hypothetical protein [Rugosimonospora sp.]
MTAFDDLILDQSIRRRVGEPGTVGHVERATRSPLATFRDLAERSSGSSIDLVTVTDGIPGHFSLRGHDQQTVVFHQRQVEVCAYLYGLTLEQRFEQGLLEVLFESAMLRLVADFLLQGGHADQALATLAKSRRVRGGIVLHGPTIDDLNSLERDERYLVEWFFALGHEIGHGLAPELASSLRNLDCLSTDTVEHVVDLILGARFSDEGRKTLKGIIRRGDVGDGPRSHASAEVLRDEAVADVFAVVCLSEAWNALCADRAGRDYSPHRLLFEAMVSMSSVMAIEQCRIMAGWFSSMSNEVDHQPLMLSGVALQARINLLHLTLRNPDGQAFLTARYPSLNAFTRFDESAFTNAARYLETRSLRLSPPLERARRFLSSPEMRDARRLQEYFEDVATDSTVRFDALDFLRVARRLHSPMLEALRDVTEGGVPPMVTSTR